MKKLLALFALIALVMFSILPIQEAESGKNGCTHWYNVSIVAVQRFDDGSAIYHSTMTRKCQGVEETVEHCYWESAMGDEFYLVPCP